MLQLNNHHQVRIICLIIDEKGISLYARAMSELNEIGRNVRWRLIGTEKSKVSCPSEWVPSLQWISLGQQMRNTFSVQNGIIKKLSELSGMSALT